MGWMSQLYQTYENNKGVAGKSGNGIPLSLVAHMISNVQIEVMIDGDGNFLGVTSIPKENSKTLIPVTESSEGRTVGIAPHPLNDMLAYVAGDFSKYVVSEKEQKKCDEKFKRYIEGLEKWVGSEYTHEKVQAVYYYVQKQCMISDLIRAGIVKLDEKGLLDSSKINGQPYEKTMVRFVVQTGERNVTPNTWEDTSLLTAYTQYYLSSIPGECDICYLTGNKGVLAQNHPKGIISSNYGAKLISGNDKQNFVYRGRFVTPAQACSISYEASQKAHKTLSWLASNQGITVGTKEKRTYICWNPGGKSIPSMEESWDWDYEEEDNICHTEPEYKQRLKKAFEGDMEGLENNDDIVIIGLDAATTGRLSILYYNELKASDYIRRLENWANTCNWIFTEFNHQQKPVEVIKTPKIRNIVTYAFGTQQGSYIDVNDKVLKEQSQRLYYCMLDGMPMPRDIMHAIAIKASTPTAYTYGNHQRVLSTACALIAKYHNDKIEGSVTMELDRDNHNRSYLFGRLLALAEQVEKVTYKRDESRMTNAIRLQAAYVNHPMRTWGVLETALIPYYQWLTKASAEFFKQQIEEVVALFDEQDPTLLNKALDEYYLIGYYTQRKELRKFNKKDDIEGGNDK